MLPAGSTRPGVNHLRRRRLCRRPLVLVLMLVLILAGRTWVPEDDSYKVGESGLGASLVVGCGRRR